MPSSAYRTLRPCPAGACPEPAATPPWCCPEPSADAERERVERQARLALRAATGSSIAEAHVAAEREQALLALELDLAERRVERLACGLDCLQSRIEATRTQSGPRTQ